MGESIQINIIWRVQNCDRTHGKEAKPFSVTALKEYLKETEQLKTTVEVDIGVGSRIEVYWTLDNKHYPRTITKDEKERKNHLIEYVDGEKETLSLSGEKWRLLKPSVTLYTNVKKLGSITNISRCSPSPHNVNSVTVQDPLDPRFEKSSKDEITGLLEWKSYELIKYI